MIAVLHWLPRWLLRMLDGWSHRVAQRRARERQRRWLARTAKPAAEPVVYHLKPWRD
jgi:hypothetical protein